MPTEPLPESGVLGGEQFEAVAEDVAGFAHLVELLGELAGGLFPLVAVGAGLLQLGPAGGEAAGEAVAFPLGFLGAGALLVAVFDCVVSFAFGGGGSGVELGAFGLGEVGGEVGHGGLLRRAGGRWWRRLPRPAGRGRRRGGRSRRRGAG
ncbi:hypothetical protein [Verrucosispora sp. WMMD1129]|uniref:hypothetical protein n=1 Tax=Verrucosispora sp. WMMD1129 TaxID=3016093 RepID=UPI00249C016B|nr:hypothetical protein [Verrucosispora sp. WMMD1129]WFE45322.1 hypothetical protein O7624_13655 [Verrucosispora sp. WMMD1129]